jgi:hypothetical protein
VSLLEGELRDAVAEALRDELLSGTLRRTERALSAGRDEHGDPTDLVQRSWDVVGFVEGYSEAFRAQAGIPATDVRVNLLAGTLPATVRPTPDDRVEVGGKTYQLRRVQTDPATALFDCQAFEVSA